jgi:hypothetical protein
MDVARHAIPENDEQEHQPADWCECQPTPMVDQQGGIVWIHSPYDCRDLIDQAEKINAVIGIELWTQYEKDHPKALLAVKPFPAGTPIYYPPAVQRTISPQGYEGSY